MAGLKERMIQYVLRAQDMLSPAANKGREALDELRTAGEKVRAELDKATDDNKLVKSLIGVAKDSERTEKSVERVNKRIELLQAELEKNPNSKGLVTSLRAAEKEAENANKALAVLKQEAAEYAEKAKAAGIDTSKLSDEEKRLAAELVKAKGAVTDNSKATKDLQKEQSAAARSAAEQAAKNTTLGNALRSVEKRVLAYAAAYISLRAAGRLAGKALDLVRSGIEKVISVGDGAEKTKIQLEGLMGSIEGGQKATAWIEEFADKSGQRINDVVKAFASLKAFGLDPMDGSMQAIIDKTAQLGGEAETLNGISLALGQMWAKEKISQEEVNQLRERGVNAYGLLSTAMNKNVAELQDMAKAGKLGRTEIRLLIEEMGRSADGQATRSLETLSGKWNVLLNQFQKFGQDIASSGAMDVVKEKLQGVLDKVIEFSDDGTLANLAEALSNAFVEGIVKLEQFIGTLSEVDFKTLTKDSADWLNNFGQNIDDAMLRVQLFFAPFRTLFNGLTAGLSTFGVIWLQQLNLILLGAEKLADAFGGDKLKASLRDAREAVSGLTEGLVEQIEQDGADIRASWETTANAAVDQKNREVDAVKAAEMEKQKAHADTSKAIDAMFSAEVEAGRLAAVEGRRNLEDLADAINVIDATTSVEELEKLRVALLKAYQEGRISQQEYEQGTGVLSGKIKTLGTAAKDAGKDFKTLSGVMDAISTAANDIDIRQAKAALDKLYREGKISAEQHKKAQEELNKKVAELKPATDKAKKGADDLDDSLKKTTSGTDDAAAAAANYASATAASFEWFMGTINAVREPLEQMSGAAKDAFNELQGIKTAPEIDLSSVEGATEALQRARDETGKLEEAMAGTFGGNISDTLSRWATQTKLNGKEVEMSFIAQKISLQQLMESYNSGALSAAAFAKAAAGARGQFNLLDESDLSALEGAVDAAKQKMDQLADSTKSTLQSLNDELLQLQGTQEDIEKSKMDSRRRDLQSQLADARKDGDDRAVRNLQQALSTLSEIESERERAARNKKAEDAKAEADKAATAKAPITQKQEPTKVIKLQLGGQSVDVGVGSSGDEAALLSILEQAGLRSM